MAKVDILFPFIMSWEGGFVNNKKDKGGATNRGVTLTTWKSQGYDKDGDGDIDINDLKLITEEDVRDWILVPHYWNRCRADEIACQSVANIIVDWTWCSGAHGITKVQNILGVKADGIIGPKTVRALNSYPDQYSLFCKIWTARHHFLQTIVKRNPSQNVFLKGWLNRLNCIRWRELEYNKNTITFA